MKIDVNLDLQQALDKLSGVSATMKEKIVVRSLNDVAEQAKTRASREIRAAGYNLKAARIKRAIEIIRARPGLLVAIVRATGKPMPLIEYDGKEDRKGRVTVKVKDGRKVVKDAFIATMASGHRGIYVRKGITHKRVVKNGRVRYSGLPIQELYGPSVPAVFGNAVIQSALEALVREKLPGVLRSNAAFYLKRR